MFPFEFPSKFTKPSVKKVRTVINNRTTDLYHHVANTQKLLNLPLVLFQFLQVIVNQVIDLSV